MKTILCLAGCFAIGVHSLPAQVTADRNTLIAQMVAEVSAKNLQDDIAKLVSFGTRSTLSVQNNKKKGIGAAREWVFQEFEADAKNADGRMSVRTDSWKLNSDSTKGLPAKPTEIANVMATLRGTNPEDDRLFIISGHLDSRRSNVQDGEKLAPGANDDGSGIAAVLEMARIMSQQRFSATILFVAFSGEEQGLWGSQHLAQEARDSGWNIQAMLNNDMIGQSSSSETNQTDNTQVRVFSEGIPLYETPKMAAVRRAESGENDSRSRELARYIREIADQYVDNLHVVLVYRPDRFLRGGDHLPFARLGYTAVRLTDYYENFYHQHQDIRIQDGIEYGDLPKFMDFEYLRKNTCLNLAVLSSVANAPSVPQQVKIDVSKLGNTTKIYWDAPKIGKPKGYYLLMRETDEPMWQKKYFTPDLQIIVPYSKDNYFFAVQAVGNNGLVSLPVFPDIGR